ncbi:hypothetical protein SAMN05444161_8902 [Rhizobiales bacterium GAS191]|nr:hypothetical protein SAMN05444161_8902 [Rhizobiales bacterium GAS191]
MTGFERWMLILLGLLCGLAACAHKDLTAPCDRGEGGWFSDCGRLRPVNSFEGRGRFWLGL